MCNSDDLWRRGHLSPQDQSPPHCARHERCLYIMYISTHACTHFTRTHVHACGILYATCVTLPAWFPPPAHTDMSHLQKTASPSTFTGGSSDIRQRPQCKPTQASCLVRGCSVGCSCLHVADLRWREQRHTCRLARLQQEQPLRRGWGGRAATGGPQAILWAASSSLLPITPQAPQQHSAVELIDAQ